MNKYIFILSFLLTMTSCGDEQTQCCIYSKELQTESFETFVNNYNHYKSTTSNASDYKIFHIDSPYVSRELHVICGRVQGGNKKDSTSNETLFFDPDIRVTSVYEIQSNESEYIFVNVPKEEMHDKETLYWSKEEITTDDINLEAMSYVEYEYSPNLLVTYNKALKNEDNFSKPLFCTLKDGNGIIVTRIIFLITTFSDADSILDSVLVELREST